jgi:Ca2+-binding EF-hand superfamily protein
MTIHRVLILAVAALPFLTCDVAAQDMARYRSWDRNNDGMISRAEWRGTPQQFRSLDWNRDGVLSGDEIWDSETDDSLTGESFEALDRNNDGRLTRGEWRADRAAFLRVDRNGDNHISRGEFLNANAGYRELGTDDFDQMDVNGSGRIERGEWSGTRATFSRLDRNGDGMLTPRELAQNDAAMARNPAAPAVLGSFDAMDGNNNEVISRQEWRGALEDFNRFDANRDGVLSRREYTGGGTAGRREAIEDVIRIDSRQPWTSTGIYVNAGDVLTYRAAGMIQMSTNAEDRATPAGALSGRTARNSPRPDQRAGALLFRVGNTGVGVLGENGSFTAPASGELSFGVNDDHFPDNAGEYQVVLTRPRR